MQGLYGQRRLGRNAVFYRIGDLAVVAEATTTRGIVRSISEAKMRGNFLGSVLLDNLQIGSRWEMTFHIVRAHSFMIHLWAIIEDEFLQLIRPGVVQHAQRGAKRITRIAR
jgi:hypothetical protein